MIGLQEEWLLPEDVMNHLESNAFADMGLDSAGRAFSDLVDRLELEKMTPHAKREALMTWLRILVAWIFENKEDFPDPFDVIEQIYADFGYPEEIRHLVRYNAPDDGDSVEEYGMPRMMRLWKEYCDLHMGHQP